MILELGGQAVTKYGKKEMVKLGTTLFKNHIISLLTLLKIYPLTTIAVLGLTGTAFAKHILERNKTQIEFENNMALEQEENTKSLQQKILNAEIYLKNLYIQRRKKENNGNIKFDIKDKLQLQNLIKKINGYKNAFNKQQEVEMQLKKYNWGSFKIKMEKWIEIEKLIKEGERSDSGVILNKIKEYNENILEFENEQYYDSYETENQATAHEDALVN